jgi:hypothetical protein
MQQPRQLYGLGSLVKKITRPIKKIVKSPIGKAALLGAATYGLGGGFGSAGFQKSTLLGRLGLGRFAGAGAAPGSFRAAQEIGVRKGLLSKLLGGAKDFAFANPGKAALLGLGAAGVAAPFFFGKEEEEEIIEDPFSVTPSSIADIRLMARNRDPSLAFLPQAQFVQPGFYAAEGGIARLGYNEGANEKINMIKDMLSKGADDELIKTIAEATQEEINQVKNSMAEGGRAKLAGGGNRLSSLINLMRNAMDRGDMDAAEIFRSDIFKEFGLRMNKGGIARLNLGMGGSIAKAMEMGLSKDEALNSYKTFMKLKQKDGLKMSFFDFLSGEMFAKGGRVGLREGTGGIASLPKVRMLEGGVPEIDYRQSGGFVPVGKKEKADDVPAMLSKNEFVMTADAVRGMGDGSVEKGAQRMYDQMKQLESRVA